MDSDTTATSGETPEEKPDAGAPAEKAAAEEKPPGSETAEMPPAGEKPPEPPAAPTASAAAVKPPKQYNWMLIALIAVSCVAVFLLIVTLALGAGLAFHHERGGRFQEFGRRQMGPMMQGYGEGGQRQGSPWLQQSAPPAQSAPPSGQ